MLVQVCLFSEHHMDQIGHRLSILINTLLASSFEQHWLIREILQVYIHKCNIALGMSEVGGSLTPHIPRVLALFQAAELDSGTSAM